MIYVALYLIMSFALELLVIRAYIGVLDMRFKLGFIAAHLLMHVLNAAALLSNIRGPFQSLFVSMTMTVLLPLVFSRGPFRVRLFRIVLIVLTVSLCELFCSGVYALMSGEGSFPSELNQQTAPLMIAVYLLAIPMSTLLFELIIAVCRQWEGQRALGLELPVIMLMGISAGLFFWLVLLVDYTGVKSWVPSVYASFCCLLLIVTCLVLLQIARLDEQRARTQTNQAASQQQDKHVRDEVLLATRRSLGLRRLRHDLANQMDVVAELARAGRVEEADAYLAQLEQQALSVMRGSNE